MTETLACIIVEDEIIHRKSLEAMVARVPYLNLIASYSTFFDFNFSNKKNQADLLFFDIHVLNESGLDVAKNYVGKGKVIFTTSLPQHALAAYDLGAQDYLLKPFGFEQFEKAVSKAKEILIHESTLSQETLEGIAISDILYIQSLNDFLVIVYNGGRKEVRLTLKGILSSLDKNTFVRAHKSFIVNVTKIDFINKLTIHIGDHKIPMGKARKNELLEKLKLL
ncbi:MAG: response regulator transcription factor [Flavobacteriales bacterium]|nr:response regulator transcription factor [Flavobacteriales bacterium]